MTVPPERRVSTESGAVFMARTFAAGPVFGEAE
jgi:hypothetical protein